MFKPISAKDRINYGEALMPPAGFRLEHAVGTTYSLDLETLTAVSIAVGLIEDTESELARDPISLLSALQIVSDRIVVFCEAGQIKFPVKMHALYLSLEKMVVPVSLPYDKENKRHPSFHPKVWLLEFVNNKGKKKYRFVVMSRNTTFDHSWDIACSLEGDDVSIGEVDTQPITDFLKFLKKQLNKRSAHFGRQSKILSCMIKASSRMRFMREDKFSECAILPLGIGTNSYDMVSDPLFTENFHELVVMSPFLSGSIIEEWNNNKKTLTGTKRTLITRRSELSKIRNGKASNYDVYVMKDAIIDGESAISEEDEQSYEGEYKQQDIHAKVYIKRKNNNVDLYLGSMNASHAAVYSNVEMMLRLRTKSGVLDGEKFLNDIMGEDRKGSRNPFEVVVSVENAAVLDEESNREAVERLLKKISRIKMLAHVEKNNDKYDVRVSAIFRGKIEGVTISPLQSDKKRNFSHDMCFNSLGLLEVSEFYTVSATIGDCSLKRVIMIPTTGIPEERDAAIIKTIISKREKFIEYVAFVLGDNHIQSFIENKKSERVYSKREQGYSLPAVYEKMLKISVSDPNKLGEIQGIIRVIEEEEIVPTEFKKMYKTFCDTLGIKLE